MRLLALALLVVASSTLVCGFRFHQGLGAGQVDAIRNVIDRASHVIPPQVLPMIVQPIVAPTTPSAPTSNSSDIEFPGRLLQSLELDADETARASLGLIDRDNSIYRQISQVVLPSQDEGCCKCVGKTAHHIIDSTYDAVKTACSNVTCPVIQAECKWIEDHEERYKGFLVARIRPGGLGWSYCLGTGECKHPNYTAVSTLLASPKMIADETYLPLQTEDFLNKFLAYSKKNATMWSKLFDNEEGRKHQQLSENLGGDEGKDGRRKCARHVIKKIMKHAVKHLIHVCKTTKCPKMQKFCAWAKDHKDNVRGYMYGKIEPWKFAMGFCAARRHDGAALE